MKAYRIPEDEFAAAILEKPVHCDTISIHERQQAVSKNSRQHLLLFDLPQ
jgi:hypothetical protein